MNEALIVVGLGFGDEGKGSIVDYLARRHALTAGLVVRFNGGAQAGHRVVTREGYDHVFSQFGAGTLAGWPTFLSRHMLVNPLNLLVEADGLPWGVVEKAWTGLKVDPEAVIITPYHVAVNRLKERCRGNLRHGSCGQGVGEARAGQLSGTMLQAKDLRSEDITCSALAAIQFSLKQEMKDYYPGVPDYPEFEMLNRPPSFYVDDLLDLDQYVQPWEEVAAAHAGETFIFEGAQGALLDETHGFYMPHVSWTNTTTANAWSMLGEVCWTGGVRRIGVIRTYHTRHGAGPFPTEDEQMTADLPDARNGNDLWQGGFRVGTFDPILFDHALSFCPVNEIALTCCDRHPEPDIEWTVPVTIKSYGVTADDKREVRTEVTV